jgi:hypothetical protein
MLLAPQSSNFFIAASKWAALLVATRDHGDSLVCG